MVSPSDILQPINQHIHFTMEMKLETVLIFQILVVIFLNSKLRTSFQTVTFTKAV